MPTRFKSWSQRIITAFLVFLVSLNAKAQQGELLPELDQFSGLQSNGVRCIKIDSKGRVWVGTDNGLNILNANTAVYSEIENEIGGNSIWSIEFKDSLVFVGTRFNGLYLFNRFSGERVKHFPSSTISLIRKIKNIENDIFILTNNGPYKWENSDLLKLSINSQNKSDFIIDVFRWDNEVFGLVYPAAEIKRLIRNSFEKNETEQFLGSRKLFPRSSIFCAATYGNKLYLGLMGVKPYLMVIERNAPPVFLKRFESLGPGFIIWDIVVVKGKIAMAIGDVYSNSKGLVYILNPEVSEGPVEIKDFVNCLAIDSAHNALYYGTLSKGFYFQSAVLTSVFKRIPGESEFVKRKSQAHTYEKWTKPFVFGDTLILAHDNRIELFSERTGRLLFSLPRDKLFPYFYINSLQILNNSVFTFDSYGWIYKYDLDKRSGWAIEKIESSLPYPQKFDNKIILLNRERGFNFITETESYPLVSNDKSIPFVTDFTLIHDTLYTISRNSLKAFRIDHQTKELKFVKEYNSINLIEGFVPKWILSYGNSIYLLNDNGILKINVNRGVPVHYYYWGNYSNLKKPTVEGESLVLLYNGISQGIPFTSIDNTSAAILKEEINVILPNSVNENLGFKISVSGPEYLMQNRHLKSLEIWQKGKLKEIKYSTTSTFNLANGLKFGDYDLLIKKGNSEKRAKLSITLPLNRNPYFFGTLVFFILIFILLFLKTRYDRKELNKKLSENRMQVLKQNLNPHFVYNSMNLINSLILEEKYDDAVQVVSEFSKLQRTFLETNNKEVITLKDEFDFLEVYLRLQQRRFHYDNKFTYAINVAEGIDTNTIMIPPLILQPLVENAIKHGIVSNEEGERHIVIDVSGTNPFLIGVEDNGNGVDKSSSGFGMGHKLVEERINLFNAGRKSKLVIAFDMLPLKSKSGYRVELSYTKPH